MLETSVHKPLFGKEIEFVLFDADKEIAGEVIETAYQEGLRLQSIFNFFDEKSVLSLLNKRRKLEVPNEFVEVLERALELCKETNGSYDVSLGKQFLERKKNQKLTPVRCSYHDIKIHGNIVELIHPDVMIDLGSIAKGYIADKVVSVLKQQGAESGLVDARGDIVVFGYGEKIVNVQNPRIPERSLHALKVRECGIATSGDYKQYHGSFDENHILNSSEYSSVTVIASSLMEADLYATVIFVSGKSTTEKILKENPHLRVLCVDKHLKESMYNGFEGVIAHEV